MLGSPFFKISGSARKIRLDFEWDAMRQIELSDMHDRDGNFSFSALLFKIPESICDFTQWGNMPPLFGPLHHIVKGIMETKDLRAKSYLESGKYTLDILS